MRARILVCLILCAAALPALASPGAAAAHDPLDFIGMDMKTVIDTLGTPQDLFTFRGTEESRDSVVFYYPEHVYLFWYKDRVWQVRYDKRFTDMVRGFAAGMTQAQAQSVANQALVPNGDSLYFDINERSYPVRIRLLFAGDILSDIYVYRSDF